MREWQQEPYYLHYKNLGAVSFALFLDFPPIHCIIQAHSLKLLTSVLFVIDFPESFSLDLIPLLFTHLHMYKMRYPYRTSLGILMFPSFHRGAQVSKLVLRRMCAHERLEKVA